MIIQPLFVDCYAGDLGGMPNWAQLVGLGAPWCGGIVKATEGTWYSPGWFDNQWRALKAYAGNRYGVDWFRGAYHFLKFDTDGAAQADYYLKTIERAGGWETGDFWPIVDVELGGEKNSNQLAGGQQIRDCTTAFAERCTAVTGRRVMLYGNGAMRDRGIRDRMGCSYLWLPRYTATLPKEIYERAGWRLDDLVAWQYSGDGVSVLPGYPSSPPGFGKVDTSAVVHAGGLDWLRSQLFAEKP